MIRYHVTFYASDGEIKVKHTDIYESTRFTIAHIDDKDGNGLMITLPYGARLTVTLPGEES